MRFTELFCDPSIEQLNVNAQPRVLLSLETRRMARELLADDFRLHLLAQDNLKELLSELDQGAFQPSYVQCVLSRDSEQSSSRNFSLSRSVQIGWFNPCKYQLI